MERHVLFKAVSMAGCCQMSSWQGDVRLVRVG